MPPSQEPVDGPAASDVAPIGKLLAPLRAFANHPLAGAALLLAATAIALVWASSRWAHVYAEILHAPVSLSIGSFSLTKSVQHFVNDGLMGVFFFLVGLEIKRELLVGELSSPGRAALPAVAAIGGMIVPALIYLAIVSSEDRVGWGIPMATDIAFALGVLALVGKRVPASLRVLLTALAIVDDIGAVLVIAIFYTAWISTGVLVLGLAGIGVSIAMNLLGVRNPLAYLCVGLLVWLAFLESGVHATLAALLMAFTIPTRTRVSGSRLVTKMEDVVGQIREIGPAFDDRLNSPEEQHVIDELVVVHEAATPPLQRIENALAGVVTLVILPVFALANAGVGLRDVGLATLSEGVTLGIAAGLVIGKPVGIVAISWIAVRLRLAALPQGVTWMHVLGLGLLGGIGFTMALFIGGLAFATASQLAAVKIGILGASMFAGTLGYLVLRLVAVVASRRTAAPEPDSGAHLLPRRASIRTVPNT